MEPNAIVGWGLVGLVALFCLLLSLNRCDRCKGRNFGLDHWCSKCRKKWQLNR